MLSVAFYPSSTLLAHRSPLAPRVTFPAPSCCLQSAPSAMHRRVAQSRPVCRDSSQSKAKDVAKEEALRGSPEQEGGQWVCGRVREAELHSVALLDQAAGGSGLGEALRHGNFLG